MQKDLNAEKVTLRGQNEPYKQSGDGHLAKAPQKAAARQRGAIPVNYEVQPTRRMNVFPKVKGLMVMLIGGTLVGYGMGGYDAYRAALFVGLEVLLYGFVCLAD